MNFFIFIFQIHTSTSNPSHIYAEDFYETPKCMVRNMNKIGFLHGDCGMTTERMVKFIQHIKY